MYAISASRAPARPAAYMQRLGLMWTLGPNRANGFINYKHIDWFTQRFRMLAVTTNDSETTRKSRLAVRILGLSTVNLALVTC